MGVIVAKLEGARMIGSADVTDNQIKILDRMGMVNLSQAEFFDAEQKANPALKQIMGKHEAKLANNPAYAPVLKAMGDRFTREAGVDPDPKNAGRTTTVLDTLGKDIQGNPQLAARLDKMLETGDPAVMQRLAGSLGTYKAGELAKVLDTADPASAPRVQAPAAAPAAAPAPVQKPPERKPAGTAAPATPPPPPSRPDPVTVAVPGASTATPGGSTVTATPAQPAKPADLKALAEMPNDKLAAVLSDKATVRSLAAALTQYSDKKFPDLQEDAKGFRTKIEVTALQEKIAANLSQNPELVKKLAKAISEDNPSSNKGMDGQVRSMLKEIYTKPEETIANKGWTDGLQSKMMMGGAMDWVKTNLGIDLKGMLGGLGNMLQGMFQKIGDFFKQFSSGNFMQIGNMNPKAGFFDKMGRSMDQAAAFREREPALREQSELLARPGAKGPINDGAHGPDGKPRMKDETVAGPDGKPVTTKVADYRPEDDHRVSVNAIGNNNNKVYLTDNIQPTREPNGNYRWTVAESIDPNTGRAGQMRQLVVSPEESQRLFKVMEQSAAASGKPLKIQNPNLSEPTAEVQSQRTVMAYNQGTRQLEQVQQGPAANQPGTPSALNQVTAPKPGDPEFRPGMPAGGAVA
jgi:hypothetical protein